MPSDFPGDLAPRTAMIAIPYFRTMAFTAGFFTVLALLMIGMQFVPVAAAV